MGERIEDGGPAFPKPLDPYPNAQGMESGSHGMSLRDWFAGQAHAGAFRHEGWINTVDDDQGEMARRAYAIADAMLEARSNPKASPHV